MNTDLNTALARRLGIRYPIFGFSHSIDVTVALANAGCFPVYGATRDMPDQIVRHLAEIRDRIGDGRFGVDLLLPSSVGSETDRAAVVKGLPEPHKQFIEYLRSKYNVPAATHSTFFSSQIRSQQLFAEQIDAVPVEIAAKSNEWQPSDAASSTACVWQSAGVRASPVSPPCQTSPTVWRMCLAGIDALNFQRT